MELILFLASVFLISFTGAMMPGPVTAVVIGNAKRTPWAGFIVAAGHAVIEVPLVIFLAFYAANFMENPVIHAIVAFAGGAMLIWLGVDMIRSSNKDVEIEGKDMSAFVGGIVTSINPYFIVWWATTGLAMILQAKTFGNWVLIFFVITHLSVDFIWDGLLGFLAHRSGVFNHPTARKVLYIVLGSCLILVAGYFILSGLKVIA
jgi:threonine/homoserine/homoserine lactone efflux protein